jgi:uncharacterized protein (TIGR03067 family)
MRRVLPLLAVLSLAFAPAPFPRPEKRDPSTEDLKWMQGTWDDVSIPEGQVIVIAGDKMSLYSGDRSPRTLRIHLDARKSPRTIDARALDARDTDETSSTRPGVYKLEGGTLLIHLDLVGDSRPTDFKLTKCSHWLYVLKRKKP